MLMMMTKMMMAKMRMTMMMMITTMPMTIRRDQEFSVRSYSGRRSGFGALACFGPASSQFHKVLPAGS